MIDLPVSYQINSALSVLLKLLYYNTTMQVCCNYFGHLISDIPVCKGVQQGCVLAPMLFNLYRTDVIQIQADN